MITSQRFIYTDINTRKERSFLLFPEEVKEFLYWEEQFGYPEAFERITGMAYWPEARPKLELVYHLL